MVSINSSANGYILANLRQINNDLATVQTRIGTGKKVNSSADNANAYKVATGLRSDIKAQDSLSTGIAVAKGRADTALKALDTVVNLLGQIKTLALASQADGSTDYTVAAAKLASLNAQVSATVTGARFNGENWLTALGTAGAKTVTISSSDGVATSISVTSINLNLASTGILTVAQGLTLTSNSDAAALSTGVDTAIASIAAYQATLSGFSSALGSQQDFLSALKTVRESALSELVDADLTEENAKLSALQTQQQLAYQALSISNSSAQNILRLFQ